LYAFTGCFCKSERNSDMLNEDLLLFIVLTFDKPLWFSPNNKHIVILKIAFQYSKNKFHITKFVSKFRFEFGFIMIHYKISLFIF
jgi:hypothetical protein